MRRWLPALAYDKPVTALMLFIALLVVGFIAQSRIPMQMMPQGYEPRFLWVNVSYNGASPLEVDEEIESPAFDIVTVENLDNPGQVINQKKPKLNPDGTSVMEKRRVRRK